MDAIINIGVEHKNLSITQTQKINTEVIQMKKSIATNANCATCLKFITQDINEYILCRDKGIVSYNYSCTHYKLKPVIPISCKTINRHTSLTCLQCDFYVQGKINQSTNISPLGSCSYYNLRPFTGESRRACSKFQATEKDSYIEQLFNNNKQLLHDR